MCLRISPPRGHYAGVIAEPHAQAEHVAQFLAPEYTLNVAAMAKAVDLRLYRQRIPASD